MSNPFLDNIPLVAIARTKRTCGNNQRQSSEENDSERIFYSLAVGSLDSVYDLKILDSFIDYTPSSSSEDPVYPLSNMKDLDPIKKSKILANVIFDFSTSTSIASLYLQGCNFQNFTLEGNDTNSWDSPSYSTDLTITKGILGNRYGLFEIIFNYRYARLIITDLTFDNSDPNPIIGKLFFGNKKMIHEINPHMIVDRYNRFASHEGSSNPRVIDLS